MNKPIHRYKIFWLLLLLAIYFIVGHFYAPTLIKQQIISQLADQFDMQTEVESVSFNPFNFNTNINGLNITDVNQENWFYSQQVGINFDPTKLLWSEWKFSDLKITQPKISIHTNDEGQVLIPALPDFPEVNNNQEINFSIEHIEMTQGNIDYQADNIKNDFKLNIKDIDFNLDNFILNDIDTHFMVSITTANDELINLNGSYNHSRELINTAIKLIDFQVSTLAQVLPESLFITQTSGTIHADGGINWQLNQNPELEFSGIKIQSLQGQFHGDIAIKDLNLNAYGVLINTETQNVIVNQIESEYGIWQLNWPFNDSLLEQTSNPQPDKRSQVVDADHKALPTWQLNINNTSFKNWSVGFNDLDLKELLALKIHSLDMRQVNNLNQAFSIDSQINFVDQGSIFISSEQTLSPLILSAVMKVNQVSLQKLSPWIEAQSSLIITQGQLSSEQKITFKNKQFKSIGNMLINDVHIKDQNSIPIASWKHLQIGSSAISSQNKTLTFDHIIIDQSKGVVPIIAKHNGINSKNTSSDDWTLKIGSIDTAQETEPE